VSLLAMLITLYHRRCQSVASPYGDQKVSRKVKDAGCCEMSRSGFQNILEVERAMFVTMPLPQHRQQHHHTHTIQHHINVSADMTTENS
jgi:hypothetical protein